jgi:hypothetical protein
LLLGSQSTHPGGIVTVLLGLHLSLLLERLQKWYLVTSVSEGGVRAFIEQTTYFGGFPPSIS